MENRVEKILSLLNSMDVLNEYNGVEVGHQSSYITIDRERNISLIIKAADKKCYQVSTHYLTLCLGSRCLVTTPYDNFNENCHILSCKTKDPLLLKTFIFLSLSLVDQLNGQSKSEELVEFFNNLVQLFKIKPTIDIKKARQGLWGELFVMKQTGDISGLMKYWHTKFNRKFDFSNENSRIEVKTTIRMERIHAFSHDQIYREDNTNIAIVSLLLQEEDAGLSLGNLISFFRKELEKDITLLIKLEKAVKFAGLTDNSDSGPIYDENLARNSLAWFKAVNLPQFPHAEPQGVSNTHYNIDLSNAIRMTDHEVSNLLLQWN